METAKKILIHVKNKTTLNYTALKARYRLNIISKSHHESPDPDYITNQFRDNLFVKVSNKKKVNMDVDLQKSIQKLKKQSFATLIKNEEDNSKIVQSAMKTLTQVDLKNAEQYIFKKKLKRKPALPKFTSSGTVTSCDESNSNILFRKSIPTHPKNSQSLSEMYIIPTHPNLPRKTISKFGVSKYKSLLFSNPGFEEKYQKVKKYGRIRSDEKRYIRSVLDNILNIKGTSLSCEEENIEGNTQIIAQHHIKQNNVKAKYERSSVNLKTTLRLSQLKPKLLFESKEFPSQSKGVIQLSSLLKDNPELFNANSSSGRDILNMTERSKGHSMSIAEPGKGSKIGFQINQLEKKKKDANRKGSHGHVQIKNETQSESNRGYFSLGVISPVWKSAGKYKQKLNTREMNEYLFTETLLENMIKLHNVDNEINRVLSTACESIYNQAYKKHNEKITKYEKLNKYTRANILYK